MADFGIRANIPFLFASLVFFGGPATAMTVLSPGDTLTIPIVLTNKPGNPASDAPIHPRISFSISDFMIFQATASTVGPHEILVGSSWAASGVFFVSTSARAGCGTIFYAMSDSPGEVTTGEHLVSQQYFIIPAKLSPRRRAEYSKREAECARMKPKVRWDTRWSDPLSNSRLIPEPPRDKPLIPDTYSISASSLPRGDYGFTLGVPLAEAYTNAARLGLSSTPATNDAQADRVKLFLTPRDPEIYAINMSESDGLVNYIAISFGTPARASTFEKIRDRLRKRLGKEQYANDQYVDKASRVVGESSPPILKRSQLAFWSDCTTVLRLQSEGTGNPQLSYHDLRPGSKFAVHMIGGGPSFSFWACAPFSSPDPDVDPVKGIIFAIGIAGLAFGIYRRSLARKYRRTGA